MSISLNQEEIGHNHEEVNVNKLNWAQRILGWFNSLKIFRWKLCSRKKEPNENDRNFMGDLPTLVESDSVELLAFKLKDENMNAEGITNDIDGMRPPCHTDSVEEIKLLSNLLSNCKKSASGTKMRTIFSCRERLVPREVHEGGEHNRMGGVDRERATNWQRFSLRLRAGHYRRQLLRHIRQRLQDRMMEMGRRRQNGQRHLIVNQLMHVNPILIEQHPLRYQEFDQEQEELHRQLQGQSLFSRFGQIFMRAVRRGRQVQISPEAQIVQQQQHQGGVIQQDPGSRILVRVVHRAPRRRSSRRRNRHQNPIVNIQSNTGTIVRSRTLRNKIRLLDQSSIQ